MAHKVAILMDGGFVKKKLSQQLKRFPTVEDVTSLAAEVMRDESMLNKELLRVYFYDAPPFEGTVENPIDHSRTNFSTTVQAKQNDRLLKRLELQKNFAVRRGLLRHSGWKLGKRALDALSKKPRPLEAGDIVPDLQQKGVDMRIGLDIAWLSLKRIIESIVLVTGDSDFVPAMKVARKEGITVYLLTLGHPVFQELKIHADIVL